MKRLHVTLAGIFVCLSLSLSAQVPNSSFETINAAGNIANWTSNVLIAISIDSNGHSDSFVIDSAFYFSTTDAHSGMRAMEMRNGYNFTSNTAYAGTALASINDSEYNFFQTLIPVSSHPSGLNFYYKYFPVANEFALGSMKVLDGNGNEVGNANFAAINQASNYTLATAPVNYTDTAAPAFVTIQFSTCIPSQTPALGTRFLVDDVSITATTAIQDRDYTGGAAMICFPTQVEEELTLSFKGITEPGVVTLIVQNVTGKLVLKEARTIQEGKTLKLNVSHLSQGSYWLQAIGKHHHLNARFIK
ncbi:MAG TPA: hypothetical protein VL098_07360 [Flavipsychrobacter sp.]|nr:hypothetical protein [Flavipsychrobacter sp.]